MRKLDMWRAGHHSRAHSLDGYRDILLVIFIV